jgi:hypothetical protein
MSNAPKTGTHAILPMPLMNAIIALLNATPAGTMNCRQILNALDSDQCQMENWVPPEHRTQASVVPASEVEKKPRQQ